MELRNKLQNLVTSVFFIVLFAANKCLSCHSHIVSHIVEENKELGCEDNELYYQETDKCYEFNSRGLNSGPCGNLMFLNRQQENSKKGRCDCIALDELPRPLFYDKRSKQCYFIFSQGPCKANMHVGIVNERPKCVNNPCASRQKQIKNRLNISHEDFVKYRGVCEQLGSRCGRNGIITFVKKSANITCEERVPENPIRHDLKAIGAIGASNCPDGQHPNLVGKCQEAVELDF